MEEQLAERGVAVSYEAIRRYRILGFATVNPRDIWAPDVVAEFAGKGFVGVKIHPPIHRFRINDELLDDFYGAVAALDIPLVVHTGVSSRLARYPYHSMPILLDEVAKRHRGLRIIMAHAGGAAFCRQALAVAQSNRNCYIDLSATIDANSSWFIPRDELLLLIRLCGSHKVMYGADWPWGATDRVRHDLEFVDSLPITAKDKDNILGETLRRCLARG